MTVQWKDPDDGIVHIIRSHGQKTTKHQPHEHSMLHTLSIDEIAAAFSRIVTLRCGRRLQIDNDECILPEGEALLQVPPPILRPWMTTHESPSCIVCVTEAPDTEFYNYWAKDFRGA